MNDDFDKNMQIISGADVQKRNAVQLSAADKKKISDAYFKMFFNLTFTNWLRGGNLGTAWYKALSQIKQFVGTKNPSNPAAMYLRQIYAAHNARWAQVMMTNPHRDDVITATADIKQKWNTRATQNTAAALQVLNSTITAYALQQQNNKSTTVPQSDAIKIAAQKMQMMILMQMRQNQNGGMAA